MRNSRLIGFFAALALLSASCDRKEALPDNESSNGYVPVRIRSMSVAEGGSESLGRAFSQREQETITRPIGDGMLLEMSIKQTDSPLRDKVLLEDGKKFRVIAVNHGFNTYYSHGDFTVGESGPSNDFHVEIGKPYDYICISYNSKTDLPDDDYELGEDLDDELSIDNANDILWCRINNAQNVPASPGVVELDILLAQKLAKVSVIVDCNYNKWKIGVGENKVSIRDVATSGTIDLSTGDITSGTASTQLFPSFSATVDATSQTSNELRIMPKASSTITITILASAVSRVDLSNVPTASKTATLITPLVAGISYAITVRLRLPIWARSNIYWDDGTSYNPVRPPKLTFIPAADDPADNVDDHQGYQGVFFKWGSLVGISPARTSTSNNFSGSTPVYIPTYNKTTYADSSWEMKNSHSYTSNGWIETKNGTTENGTANIPYLDGRAAFDFIGNTGRSSTFLTDAAQNTDDMYEGRRGDICQYLSKTKAVTDNYRLPISNEFGPYTTSSWTTGTANADGWIKGKNPFPSANTAAGEPDGTANLLVAAENNGNEIYGSANSSPMGVVFPASGYRNYSGGALGGVGEGGYYWSGSASSEKTTDGHSLDFTSSRVYPHGAVRGSYAYPIRCVKY
jgi:hypothetical protein